MLSRRSTQVAMQAAILLALEPRGKRRRVNELAAELDVPATYLTKVLQNLTRAGLVEAARGPHGGVCLARPAREVSLWDVWSAVEPAGEMNRCILGLGRCGEACPCPLHESWAPQRERLVGMLRAYVLCELTSNQSFRELVRNREAAEEPHGVSD
jgi:Rrf2 family protein